MFDNSIKRIGFCCKYLHTDQSLPVKQLKQIQEAYTEKCTTVAWLNRQSKATAEQRLLDIVQHNMQSAWNLVNLVGDLPQNRRMVRLGSNQIPVATEPNWRYIWQDPTNLAMLQVGFAKIGELARQKDVRLSFHPGQFCVLASATPEIVQRSIEEFEYHADMVRWMGYGVQFQDFKTNVHISGRLGPDGIRHIVPKLSAEARNSITIENDEMCWGLDASLQLVDVCALVVDLHHHWVRDGEYIQADDDRMRRVIDSWRGVRPALHYSYSRCEHLPESSRTHSTMHDMQSLLESGCKKQKLRAHSDYYPNTETNQWALSFWNHFDIQCEAKAKNLASAQLYAQSTVSDASSCAA
jgi:UV DNA damage endonuclease